LFPDCDEPENDDENLQFMIERALIEKGLQLNENLVVKVMQLHESNVTRHGNMLVGSTMSGKTSAWTILRDALNKLAEEEKAANKDGGEKHYMSVKTEIINPKSITIDELFGGMDD